MKISVVIAGFLIVLFAGCKKENIAPHDIYGETPIFSVVGTIDGQDIAYYAGIDASYLTTYTTSVHGVNRFSGKMFKGESYVDFGIFDGNLFSNSSFSEAGNNLTFTKPYTTELFILNRQSCTNASLIDHLDIKLNNVSVGQSLIIYEPGVYTVCVNAYFYDGTNKEVCNEVTIGYKDMAKFDIQYSMSQQGTLLASTQTSLTKTQTKWYVDGVFSSSEIDFTHNLSPGLHILTAEVSFSNGATKSHSVIVDSESQGRYFEEFNSFKADLSASAYQDFNATLDVKIGDVLYKHIAGTGNQSVILTGLSVYGKGPTGNDIYKVSGIINTPMKNMNNQEIVDAQFNVVFGLEIP